MNSFIRALSFLLFIGYSIASAMTSKSFALKRATIGRMTQPIRHIYTTRPRVDISATKPTIEITAQPSISTPLYRSQQPITFGQTFKNKMSSLWNSISNWFSKPTPTIQILPSQEPILAPTQLTPPQIMPKPISQKPFVQLDTITSLSQAENLLKSLENTELNKQQKILHIANPQWQNLLQKTQQHIDWIKSNCFKKHNPNASHDSNIPENIYDRITFFLNKAHINPASINIRYQDTTHIDPFGHKVISVKGPILEYVISPAFQGDAITGYKPATITLHSQIVNTLSPNELDAELQHAITHLTQGHTEQIKLLENAIGTEQYENYIQSPEGQQFIASLETTADFLEPIKDPQVAKIVQKAFFEKAFESALDAIKENRKKHGLENTETGLMICTPPGIDELKFLAELQSFNEIENYFTTERRKILRKAGLNNDEIKNLEDELKNDKEYLEKNYYQTPIDGIFHDPTLTPEILEEIKTLLHKAGINPLSVEIINQTKAKMNGFAYAQGPIVENGIVERKAQIGFCQELIQENIKNRPREYVTFAIGHEIGHLIRNHIAQFTTIKKAIAEIFLKKHPDLTATEMFYIKGIEKTNPYGEKKTENLRLELDNTIHKIKALAELEADTTYLMRDINQAKIVHATFTKIIAAAKKDTSKEKSPLHMSYNDQFHWSNKIVQLHAKEKAQKNKPFTPDTIRE